MCKYCECTCVTYTHKDGSEIVGLEDGGVTFRFKDAPPHHQGDIIEVSFSPKTLKRMKKIGRNAAFKAYNR
jgi:hypothetical protein